MGSNSRDNQGEAQEPQSDGIIPYLEQMAEPETWDFLKCNPKEHFVLVQRVKYQHYYREGSSEACFNIDTTWEQLELCNA